MNTLQFDKDKYVLPGVYDLVDTLHLNSGAQLRARLPRTVTLRFPESRDGIHVDGDNVLVENIDVDGALEGIVLMDSTSNALIIDSTVKNCVWPCILVKKCDGCLIERCIVWQGHDNGIQFEGGGIIVRNCLFVGQPMGKANKLIDSSGEPHIPPRDIRIVHNTIVDAHSYSVGLVGWNTRPDLVFANNLVLTKGTGPGANGYAINAPNGGTFAGNVVFGTAPGAAVARRILSSDPLVVLARRSWTPSSFQDVAPASRAVPQIGAADDRWLVRYDALGGFRPREGRVSGAVATGGRPS